MMKVFLLAALVVLAIGGEVNVTSPLNKCGVYSLPYNVPLHSFPSFSSFPLNHHLSHPPMYHHSILYTTFIRPWRSLRHRETVLPMTVDHALAVQQEINRVSLMKYNIINIIL